MKSSPTCVGVTVIVGFLVIFFGVWAGEEAFHKNQLMPSEYEHVDDPISWIDIERSATKKESHEANIFSLFAEEPVWKESLQKLKAKVAKAEAAPKASVQYADFTKMYRSCENQRFSSISYEPCPNSEFKPPVIIDKNGREEIFQANMAAAKKLNEQDKTATYGMNLFSDFEKGELPAGLKVDPPTNAPKKRLLAEACYTNDIATSCPYEWTYSRFLSKGQVDWSTAVNPLKKQITGAWIYNQRATHYEKSTKTNIDTSQTGCDDCYALVSAEYTAAQVIKNGGGLSEALGATRIVQCLKRVDPKIKDGKRNLPPSCQDGQVYDALRWIGSHKLPTYLNYPYEASFYNVGTCMKAEEPTYGFTGSVEKVEEWSERTMMQLLDTVGPVIVAINCKSDAFSTYQQGIIGTTKNSDSELNHAVLIVGYGTDSGTKQLGKELWLDLPIGTGYSIDYWKIQNSWGRSYGEDGFLKVQRGRKLMGLGKFAWYTSAASSLATGVPLLLYVLVALVSFLCFDPVHVC